MKAGGELEAWLKTAKPGHCPCGAQLPPERGVLCASKGCRAEYLRLTTRDRRGPTYLREVVGHEVVEGKPRRVRMRLKCGHASETFRSTAQAVGGRVRCTACQTESTAPAAEVPPADG